MKLRSQISLVAVLGLGLAGLLTSPPLPGVSQATAAPVPKADPKTAPAFLYGESVADPKAPPAAGFTIKRIKWTLGTEAGAKQWPLGGKKKGREDVAPVSRTIILEKNASGVVLLGPNGKDLKLSRTKGPLADAKTADLDLRTVAFAFSPDGKTLAFGNEAGHYCRIGLEKMELAVNDGVKLHWYDGIEFSPDGTRIAYSRHDSGKDTVCVADADGKGEVKLAAVGEMKGFGFLPEGRVGVVTKTGMTTYDAKTGKAGDTVAWAKPLPIRSFGGFSPDGSAFIFDDGGPYHLDLYHIDLKTQKVTAIKKTVLEPFQRPVWVRVSAK